MRRKLFTLAAGASAVLCVATVALWIRSCAVGYRWYWERRSGVAAERTRTDRRFAIACLDGRARIGGSRTDWAGPAVTVKPSDDDRWHFELHRTDDRPFAAAIETKLHEDHSLWNHLGFYFDDYNRPMSLRAPNTATGSGLTVAFPLWMLAALTGVLPVWALLPMVRRYYLRRRRSSLGRCPACGYDLRATPDRCPECGTAAGGEGATVGPRPAEPIAPRPPAR